jgi:hypothetical protein
LLDQQRLHRELSAWRELNHPNVSKLIGIAYLDPDHPPGLVSRWVQHNDILAYIGKHPELTQKTVGFIRAIALFFAVQLYIS